MGAIFGIVDFSGKPILEERISFVKKRAGNSNPDSMNFLAQKNFLFAHTQFFSTAESRFEIMPMYDSQTGIVFVAAARLDNREKLFGVFQIPIEERRATSDGKLVFLCYEKWGEEAPKNLRGDWSFAVWDERKKRIFIARDQIGNTGLFYSFKDRIFTFSSNLSMLFDLSGNSRLLNELVLAQHLNFPPDTEPSATIWKEVFSLQPANLLTTDMSGLNIRKYWELGDIKSFNLSANNEYREIFIEALNTAVRRRMKTSGPVSTHLSCGLDSSAVTAFAARYALEHNEKIYAFTSVPFYSSDHLFPGSICNEWPIAHKLAEKYINIVHIPITATNVSPIKILHETVDDFQEPIHAAVNLFWMSAIGKKAEELGVKTMLTGQLGNGGISWSGGINRIYYLFYEGHFQEGLRALKKAGKYGKKGIWRAVKSKILRPVVKPWVDFAKDFLAGIEYSWQNYSAINTAFAKRMFSEEKIRTPVWEILFPNKIHPFEERENCLMVNAAMAGPLYHQSNILSSLQTLDPTSDLDLLEICLSVPARLFDCQGGERMFLRQSMEGILPSEIQWNQVRGKQAADLAFRLIDHACDVEDELQRLARSAAVNEYLSLTRMRQAWNHIQKNGTRIPDNGSINLLMRAIQTGIFLDRFFG
ncbi:MAG: asparagine synthase [Candidatus Riflebacteria bacterium]|nr:asparagine synthase [Candidatus Riflebacteria bacterium]